MTVVKLVEDQNFPKAEDKVNALLKEYEDKGFSAQVLNLTPSTHLTVINWRFILMFSKDEEILPDADQQQ